MCTTVVAFARDCNSAPAPHACARVVPASKPSLPLCLKDDICLPPPFLHPHPPTRLHAVRSPAAHALMLQLVELRAGWLCVRGLLGVRWRQVPDEEADRVPGVHGNGVHQHRAAWVAAVWLVPRAVLRQ
jgi:hypothetical protein